MSVVLVSAAPIIVKLAFEHGLHFCQLIQCIESFIVLTGISRSKNTSTCHFLHLVDLATNTINEDGVASTISLTTSTVSSRAVNIFHYLMMVPAQGRMMLKNTMMARMMKLPLELLIVFAWTVR